MSPLSSICSVGPSDECLWARSHKGDRQARAELFSRHRSLAYRVAFRLLGNEADALDAVQDGFVKALVNLETFRGKSTFKTWLLRVVTNAALDLGRQRGRSRIASGRAESGRRSGCRDTWFLAKSGRTPGTGRPASVTRQGPGGTSRGTAANVRAARRGGTELSRHRRGARHLHRHRHEPALLCPPKTARLPGRSARYLITETQSSCACLRPESFP